MSEIKIDNVRENSPSSGLESVDSNRVELKWEVREEKLLDEWRKECLERSEKHSKSGKKNKLKYMVFGVPSVLLPMTMGSLSNELQHHPLLNSMLLITTGTFTGVSSFFNFGSKMTSHYEFENRFNELAVEIQAELVKPKAFRISCDIFLQKVMDKFNFLCAQAPDY